MVSRRPLLTSFLCLALIVAAFSFLRLTKNDTERIKRHLALLESMVSLSSRNTPAPFLQKVKEAKLLFARNCQVIDHEDDFTGTYSPQALAALVLRFQGQVLSAKLAFYDVKITFLPGKREAWIHCTARLKGKARSQGAFDEFRELKILATKEQERWRFSRFVNIEALEK